MATWLESSDTEIGLASAVAQEISDQAGTVDAQCQFLEGLALSIAEPTSLAFGPKATKGLVAGLHAAFPDLQHVDVQKPYPQIETDLTTNFFSRIAYELAVRSTDPADAGMVPTPPTLAVDMVALAAALWLAGRTDESEDELFGMTLGPEKSPTPGARGVSAQLAKAVWYDPCVGWGIFPIAILQLLSNLRVPMRWELLQRIQGSDVDPLCVTATRIRVALLFGSLTGQPCGRTMTRLKRSFRPGDSLGRFAEQGRFTPEGPSRQHRRVDIVVGNPPYVRADRLPASRKAYLKAAYPSVAGGAVDLYNYFIAHGLLSLKDGGVLCYVSPASFQRSRSGRRTRRFISEHSTVEAVFDFDELPIFEGVSVHPSVYALRRARSSKPARVHAFQSLPESSPLCHGIRRATLIPASNFDVEGWHLAHPQTRSILDILARGSTPLIDYAGQILSGIKTGYKQAYFVSYDTAQALKADERTGDLIVPVLRPVSIRAWRADWDGTHLILVKKGDVIAADSALMQHLRRHEIALRQRSDIQGHPTWYGLRECTYYDAFGQPKIIFPDIASESRFAIETEGYLIPDGAFMIPKADYFLLGILNSCIGYFYFRTKCNSIGNPRGRGRLRLKKTYVRDFPVRRRTDEMSDLCSEIEELARSFWNGTAPSGAKGRLDELAVRLYGIPEQYWSTVRGDS